MQTERFRCDKSLCVCVFTDLKRTWCVVYNTERLSAWFVAKHNCSCVQVLMDVHQANGVIANLLMVTWAPSASLPP